MEDQIGIGFGRPSRSIDDFLQRIWAAPEEKTGIAYNINFHKLLKHAARS